MRQWVVALPKRLRYFVHRDAELAGRVLNVWLRALESRLRQCCPGAPASARLGAVSFLIRKAGYTTTTAHTGAVTLIQRFGSALNLNIHFHMLFLDGVYVEGSGSTARFRWVKAPTSGELTQLTHTIARRIARFLERHGLLERDAENSYLVSDAVDDDPMDQLMGHSITYRIAVGPKTRPQGVYLANLA